MITVVDLQVAMEMANIMVGQEMDTMATDKTAQEAVAVVQEEAIATTMRNGKILAMC